METISLISVSVTFLIVVIIMITTVIKASECDDKEEIKKRLENGETFEQDFVLHPDLLRNYLAKQTGELSRAIQEEVANSKDAGASKIVVTITGEKVVVDDNGMGISLDELTSFFKEVGHSAKIGDPTAIGKFAIGKFQMFSKGKTVYETHDLRITVDLGIKFGSVIEKMKDKYIDGTEVTTMLQHPIDSYEINKAVANLKQHFKFINTELVINGETIKALDLGDMDTYKVGNIIASINHQSRSRLFVKGVYIKQMDYNEMIEDCDLFTDKLMLNTGRDDVWKDDDESREMYVAFLSELSQLNVRLLDRLDKKSNFPSDKFDIVYALRKKNAIQTNDIILLRFIPQVQSEVKYSPKHIKTNYNNEITDISRVYSLGDDKDDIIKELKNRTSRVFTQLDKEMREIVVECNINIINFNDDNRLMNLAQQIKNELIHTRQILVIDDLPEKTRQLIRFVKRANEKIAESTGLNLRRIEPIRVGETSTVPERLVIRFNINDVDSKVPKHEQVTRIFIKLMKMYAELASESNKDLKYKRFYEYVTNDKMEEVIGKLMHDKWD